MNRMLMVGISAATMTFGVALAQTPRSHTQDAPAVGHPPAAQRVTPADNAVTPPVTPTRPESKAGPTPPNQGGQDDQAAAGGDTNQAVATTSANAAQPAKGANSFTEDQAKGRLTNNGYQNISVLNKDSDGIWRGTAEKDGTQADVWVDYKGNVGQSGPGNHNQ